MIKKTILILITLSVFSSPVLALEIERQKKWYINHWCAGEGGKKLVALPDGSICECVTDTHAISMEFGDNWEKAIENALHFADQTGKKAGITIIFEKKRTRKNWSKLKDKVAAEDLAIDLWEIKAYNKQQTDKPQPIIMGP